jgi:hypothetical protein
MALRSGNAMVGGTAVDGETLHEILSHAGELPGAAEITAMETAALSEAEEGATRSEIRALAVTAIAQLGQIAQKVTRLAALLGGELPDAGHERQRRTNREGGGRTGNLDGGPQINCRGSFRSVARS